LCIVNTKEEIEYCVLAYVCLFRSQIQVLSDQLVYPVPGLLGSGFVGDFRPRLYLQLAKNFLRNSQEESLLENSSSGAEDWDLSRIGDFVNESSLENSSPGAEDWNLSIIGDCVNESSLENSSPGAEDWDLSRIGDCVNESLLENSTPGAEDWNLSRIEDCVNRDLNWLVNWRTLWR